MGYTVVLQGPLWGASESCRAGQKWSARLPLPRPRDACGLR